MCSHADTPSELHSGTDEPGDLEIKNAVLNPDQLANSGIYTGRLQYKFM